jgi:ubiquitin carboxyl-terminal hydrolase 10
MFLQVLVLHLCRFQYTAGGTAKVHKAVAFDTKLRLLPNWLAEASSQRQGVDYTLMAVVSHHGHSSSGGHYTADVIQPDNRWLHYNDHQVLPRSSGTVLEQKQSFYLLFYQKSNV